MRTVTFEVSYEVLKNGQDLYPNMGKNSDVGKLGIFMVQEYFKQNHGECQFKVNKSGIDLKVIYPSGDEDLYEIKATAAPDIAWNKLKVSSKFCYDELIKGMQIVRICNVGKPKMEIHFLKHGIDFDLSPEARWSVKKMKS